ncbi:hypothetical protein A5735_08340 [Mycolicibacter heraklionensis]|nr:hypothetical protein A5735_08340 [Mycolicibacter heraklionensis]
MSSTPTAAINTTVTESTVEDLAVLRYLLDLTLQPLDRFDGFTVTEQFLLGALRYQLNNVAWALSLAQRTRTPAFTGYLAEAQRNAIHKMRDRRVWRYWAYEQLAGYGRWDPDPIARDNVMYSGYLAVMIGLYESLNNDRVFSDPGGLELRWSKRRSYPYDFGSLCEAMVRNMRKRPHCPQYPCEPHLIYPLCNTFALNGLLMHDRLHGTDWSCDLIDAVRTSYTRDGWIRPDGRFVVARTAFGMALPGLITGNDAWIAYWLHSLMPDIARQTWNTVSTKLLAIDADGQIVIKGKAEQLIDVGNYKVGSSGGGPTHGMLANAATEFGDQDIATAVNNSVQQRYPLIYQHGAARHSNLSVLANTYLALARFGGPQRMSDLISQDRAEHWRTGPVLAQAAYPDVLVARAVSDGSALDLVLRPGDGPVTATLGIGNLTPESEYVVTGGCTATLRADAGGTAHLTVPLRDRTELRIAPNRPAR